MTFVLGFLNLWYVIAWISASFFLWYIPLCCTYQYQIVLNHWWTFRLFPCFGFLNNDAVNIHVQILCGPMFSIFFGIHLGEGLAGSCVNSMFNFGETAKPFFKALVSFYSPIRNVLRLQFLHILANICYCPFF